jgi:hypothetical protein
MSAQGEVFEEVLQTCLDVVDGRSHAIKRGFAEILRHPEQRNNFDSAAVLRLAARSGVFDDFDPLSPAQKRRVLEAVEDNVRPESSLDTSIDRLIVASQLAVHVSHRSLSPLSSRSGI